MIGDMQRVRQLLSNIVTNAVKYTEKGHIMVTIDCDFIDQASLNLVVKVTDTGIGIQKITLHICLTVFHVLILCAIKRLKAQVSEWQLPNSLQNLCTATLKFSPYMVKVQNLQ